MKSLFMIGIGGMGMAPLALYLRSGGHKISGYDDNISSPISKLLENNDINIESKPEITKDIDAIVYSSAVDASHPCYRAASELKLPLMKRGVMLARAVADKKLIAVVGSHGKTTTSGMLISALEKEGFKFGYILGALFNDNYTLPAKFNRDSEWVIAEIDESDGTINEFSPEITLTTNFDWDHPDQYPNPGELENTFERLFQRTEKSVFFPVDCKYLKQLSQDNITADRLSFGEDGDYVGIILEKSRKNLSLKLSGRFADSEVSVPVPGRFNALNALGALAVTQYLTTHLDKYTLELFPGIWRRQTLLYSDPQLTVYEDYAHHPEEIGALLNFIREDYPDNQIVIVFQPHRYSRTLHYKEAFAEVLKKANAFYLLNVYGANESPLEGGTSADLLKLLPDISEDRIVTSVEELSDSLEQKLKAPSVLLFIGAGDITEWAKAVVARIENKRQKVINGNQTMTKEEKWWIDLSQKIDKQTRIADFESLADKTTLQVGGNTRYYSEPASEEDLRILLSEASKNKTPVYFIGRGSNLIVPDEGFQGLVIRLNHQYWKQIRPLGEGRIWAGAGVRLNKICVEGIKLGLAGFEFLEGIPGTLGGSLRMNAGAMGGWIFDIVDEVQLVTLEGEFKKIKREDVHISYRACEELKDTVAIGAILCATSSAEAKTIREKVKSFSSIRKDSQPREPSAGCIFKNPEGSYAGQIIDELGLKGRQVGAAQVSKLHGNFIINRGGATSKDVISLIKDIRREVKADRGLDLEPEVLLMGKSWEEVL